MIKINLNALLIMTNVKNYRKLAINMMELIKLNVIQLKQITLIIYAILILIINASKEKKFVLIIRLEQSANPLRLKIIQNAFMKIQNASKKIYIKTVVNMTAKMMMNANLLNSKTKHISVFSLKVNAKKN